MPLPSPNKGEKEKDFISRCMANPVMNREHPDNKERAGVCHSQWERKNMAELTDNQIEKGWWEIARVGSWNGSSGGKAAKAKITQDDIEAMAADYGPSVQEAPITIEHDESGPALGWVKELRVVGDVLQAKFFKISDVLKGWIKTGAYRTRSIEYYKPFSETNRTYLAAVTFLGAALPAVKGLKPEPVSFREGEPCFGIDDESMELAEQPTTEETIMTTAEKIVAQVRKIIGVDISNNQQKENEDMDLKLQLAEEYAKNKELETGNKALKNKLSEEAKRTTKETERADKAEASLAEVEKTSKLAEFTTSIETALKEKRILPVDAKQYLSLGEKLDDAGRTEILEDVSKRNPLRMFEELTSEDTEAGEKRTRTYQMRQDAEAGWATMKEVNPEDKRVALRSFDLMDADEKLTLAEAQQQAESE